MSLNTKQRVTLITMDILLLAELAFCIYYSHGDPETMPYTFLKLYVPVMLATFFSCRHLIRRFGKGQESTFDPMEEHGLTKELGA